MTFIPFSGAQIYSTDNLNISQRADMYTVTIRTANITELFRIIDSCKSPIFYTYNNESADLRGNTFIQNHIIEKNKSNTEYQLTFRADSVSDAMKLLHFMISGNHNTVTESVHASDNIISNIWHWLSGRYTKRISA